MSFAAEEDGFSADGRRHGGFGGTRITALGVIGDTLVAAIEGGEIYSSVDFGGSWKKISDGLPGGTVRSLQSIGDNLLAGISGDGVWRLPLSEVTDVEDIGGEVPAEFQLQQNYPNPFNPSTTIEFALPHAGFVTLRVYNILGEEVAALVSGDHAAGTFKATWDASGLPSGVYFYRLVAGEYVQTEKAVLMK